MEKIENFTEVIFHLKEKEVLCTKDHDFFVLRKDKVHRYFNGSSFVLSLKDFAELYKDNDFYLFEQDDNFIDEEKDEAYYRYYHK